MDITSTLTLIIIGLGIVIAAILIPFLVKKFGKEKVQEALVAFEYVLSIAKTLAEAVEQMHPEWSGEERLAEVDLQVKAQLAEKNITYDSAQVRAAIESAVFHINNSINENIKGDSSGTVINNTITGQTTPAVVEELTNTYAEKLNKLN